MLLLSDCRNPEPLLASPLWAAEEKLDGDRRVTVKRGNEVRGFTRNGNEVRVSEQDMALAMLSPHDWIIDGEQMPSGFVAFDLLQLNGEAITCANGARREMLASVSPFALVRRATTEEDKRELMASIQASGREGVVFKRIAAEYREGRSEDCQRWKFYESDEFTVGEVDIAKCSFEVIREGVNYGRVACGINRLPKRGEVVRVRYDRVTDKGKLLRAKLAR